MPLLHGEDELMAEEPPAWSLHVDHLDPHVLDMVQVLLRLGQVPCECVKQKLFDGHQRSCETLSLAAGVVVGLILACGGKPYATPPAAPTADKPSKT